MKCEHVALKGETSPPKTLRAICGDVSTKLLLSFRFSFGFDNVFI